MDDNWDTFEKPLRQLLGQVRGSLSTSERREIEEYINGNEFDAAMEALVDFFAEKSEPVSKQALRAARQLAEAMSLDSEVQRISSVLAAKTA